MSNPFSPDNLDPILSNYPVQKGGSGSGRYPKGTHQTINGRNVTIAPGADLYRGNLTGADLTNADLTGAYLTGANLVRANLTGADLTNADLRSANLYRANLRGVDLRSANLVNADLTNANLSDAGLHNANLPNANLTNADLTNARLGATNLTEADLTRANLTNANLIKADLTDADLSLADLSGAYLGGAVLGDAKLNGANLKGADLTGADLTNADLRGADLTVATLNRANLNGAKADEYTKLPDTHEVINGFVVERNFEKARIVKGGSGSGRYPKGSGTPMGHTPDRFKNTEKFEFIHFGKQDAKSNQFITHRGRGRGWVQTVSNHSQNTGITREESRLSSVISSITVEGSRLGFAARNGSDDYYRGWHRFTVDSDGKYTQQGASLTVKVKTRRDEDESLLVQKKELMVLGDELANKGYVGTIEKVPARQVTQWGETTTRPPYYQLNITGKYRNADR